MIISEHWTEKRDSRCVQASGRERGRERERVHKSCLIQEPSNTQRPSSVSTQPAPEGVEPAPNSPEQGDNRVTESRTPNSTALGALHRTAEVGVMCSPHDDGQGHLRIESPQLVLNRSLLLSLPRASKSLWP